MNIVELMKSFEDFDSLEGATQAEIIEAEARLKLSFSAEYREYLTSYGVASMNGHELTGIVKAPRLNVVDVTLNEREKNSNDLSNLYVIEDLGIDKIIIWQNSDGDLFQTVGDSAAQKMAKTFEQYLED